MWYEILKLDREIKKPVLKVKLSIKNPVTAYYGTVSVEDDTVMLHDNDELYAVTDTHLYKIGFIRGKPVAKTYPHRKVRKTVALKPKEENRTKATVQPKKKTLKRTPVENKYKEVDLKKPEEVKLRQIKPELSEPWYDMPDSL